MCLAIPMKIIDIRGGTGIVQIGTIQKEINVELMDGIDIGDYVLVHAGFAIEKINDKIAQETLSLLEGPDA